MGTPLRCPSKMHAVKINDHVIEVKCSSRFCGARPGRVVLHQFDLATGEVETHRYKEPPIPRKKEVRQ